MKLSPPVTKGYFTFILNAAIILTIIFSLILLSASIYFKYAYDLNFQFLSLAPPLFFLLIKWVMSKFRKDYLLKTAKEIKTKILKDVKIIVMGHTHDPVIKKDWR